MAYVIGNAQIIQNKLERTAIEVKVAHSRNNSSFGDLWSIIYKTPQY